jgi:hypothetical protein
VKDEVDQQGYGVHSSDYHWHLDAPLESHG